MSIAINWVEEGHNSFPLVCRRPAETVPLLNSSCTPLACAFKHKKIRLSPLYPNDSPLMTFLSSNLKNEQILFSVH